MADIDKLRAELRDRIIGGMCVTWRHDFGLLSDRERDALRRSMEQLYYHDILPALDARDAEIASLRSQLEAAETGRHIAFVTAIREAADIGAGTAIADIPGAVRAKLEAARGEALDHEVSAALDAALEEAGSYAELSRRAGVSDEYVRQVAIGQRPPRGKLLAFLGFATEVRFIRSITKTDAMGDGGAK